MYEIEPDSLQPSTASCLTTTTESLEFKPMKSLSIFQLQKAKLTPKIVDKK